MAAAEFQQPKKHRFHRPLARCQQRLNGPLLILRGAVHMRTKLHAHPFRHTEDRGDFDCKKGGIFSETQDPVLQKLRLFCKTPEPFCKTQVRTGLRIRRRMVSSLTLVPSSRRSRSQSSLVAKSECLIASCLPALIWSDVSPGGRPPRFRWRGGWCSSASISRSCCVSSRSPRAVGDASNLRTCSTISCPAGESANFRSCSPASRNRLPSGDSAKFCNCSRSPRHRWPSGDSANS